MGIAKLNLKPRRSRTSSIIMPVEALAEFLKNNKKNKENEKTNFGHFDAKFIKHYGATEKGR